MSQLGMARQPSRLALQPARNFLLSKKFKTRTMNYFSPSFYHLNSLLFILSIFILISLVKSASILDSDENLNENNLLAQIKFGDRLLPRNRQTTANQVNTSFNNINSFSSVNNNNNNNNNNKILEYRVHSSIASSNSNINSYSNNNINSLSISNNNNNTSNINNRNDVAVTNIDAVSVAKSTDTVSVATSSVDHNRGTSIVSIKHLPRGDDNSDLRRGGSLGSNHHTVNDLLSISDNVAVPVISADAAASFAASEDRHEGKHAKRDHPAVSVLEQQEQLKLRRNDYDIDEVIDHLSDGSSNDGQHLVAAVAVAAAAAAAANISKADRLIEMSTEFFIVPPSAATVERSSLDQQHSSSSSIGKNLNGNNLQTRTGLPRPVLILAPKTSQQPPLSNVSSITPPTIVSTHQPSGLRKEPWVVPVLVLASLTMIMMAAFEIFVLFKAWRTSPSRRHLFLGQMLLLGLFACAGLGAIITATPTVLSCGTIRFGVGVAYALVFAALLVKCVFLISLNGGVYLPAPYQGLLLLFAVLIQVAIGTQWLMTQPPDIETIVVPFGNSLSSQQGKFPMLITSSDIPRLHHTITSIPLCKTRLAELLLSLIYIVFLIIFVAVLAIKSRGIRDNYREATYIGLAIGGAIPIWLGWTLCGLAVADRHKDACVAFGLVATSATVFLVMFMPKGRQLAAMGKEGLYVEDREEQFSSISRAGSGYSPSFFHFKPIKYGVMGQITNSNSNTGNGNSSKHHATTMGGGGDRVALVSAAPPSYTRMYHYFPAHLTHPFCFYPQPPPPPPLSPPLPPPTLKAIGSSITSMTQAQLAQTLRYPGLFIRPDEANLYTTLEPTLSSNPNVYFQRSGGVHPGMMY